MGSERKKRQRHREIKAAERKKSEAEVASEPLPLGCSPQLWETIVTVGLVGLTLLVYIPALQGGYIWDDDAYVLNNLTLRSVDGLRQIWFQISATPQYYPLVHTSYWLEYRLWGLNPTGYHLVNVLLHGIGAVLLWRILKHLQVPGAWVAALIFALHPVHVESVAWITERKNVLSGAFYLGSALAFLRYAFPPDNVSTPKSSAGIYALSLLLFLCALFSKTVTSTLPAALMLIIWWKRDRILWKDVYGLIPFFVMGISLGLLTVWTETHQVGASGTEWHLSMMERILVAGRALWFYAGKLMWPMHLTFIYPRWEIDPGAWTQYMFPVGAMAVSVTLWLTRARIGKGPLVAVLFFGGTLMPALGFFDVYPFRYSFVADHFQYLASVGIITIAASTGTFLILQRVKAKDRLTAIALVVIVATLGTLTWKQAHVYKDLETLWRDTLAKNPNAWIAHNNLGAILKTQGRHDEEIHHYREALRLNPKFYEAHNNLGVILKAQGQLDEAIRHYREALRLKPDFVSVYMNLGNALAAQGKKAEAITQYRLALQLDPNHAAAHMELANLLVSQAKRDEAIGHYRKALTLDPDNAATYNNLGVALRSQGKNKEAMNHYRQALRINSNFPEAHDNLAWALKREGRLKEALNHFRESVQRRPNFLPSLIGAAWIMATHWDAEVRQSQEAIRFAERASRLSPQPNVQVLDTLAAGYAAAGQFEKATETAQRAQQLASQAGATEFAGVIRKRLALYREGQSYREAAAIPQNSNGTSAPSTERVSTNGLGEKH